MRIERRALTDAYVRNLKPAGEKFVVIDTLSPLRLKVTEKGHMAYLVRHRFGGGNSPANRTIGEVAVVKLAEARETARDWVRLGKRKDDPIRVERQRRKDEADVRAVTFGSVLDDYARLALHKQRRGAQGERNLRRAFLPAWEDKPLNEITRHDVVKVIDAIVERGATYQAHNVLGGLGTMFNWAVDRGVYGLDAAPTDRMRPKRIIGPREPRQRILTDDEVFAFWRATGRLRYPWGRVFHLLLLTAARHSEILGARWREIDLTKKILTVPAERFKSNAQHTVQLSEMATDELEALPRWATGDYLFSTDNGRKPSRMNGKAKDRLDARMLRTLRALARARGRDVASAELKGWVLHDLRRTARTHLSALRVPDQVIEMILGHGRRGLQRVYDLHRYEDEMREALELWAAKLRTITDPAGKHTNVTPLRRVG